ncbi:hypothetical protein RRG08_017312 [Elysia crispata]|uniref:Secreted protein n=1 Tax=Elysia crispata TaxID=231223 RepID=A0AAE0YS76_9GAST|nr:hypothetical protein RRG08_017312 [Elysia crispata]
MSALSAVSIAVLFRSLVESRKTRGPSGQLHVSQRSSPCQLIIKQLTTLPARLGILWAGEEDVGICVQWMLPFPSIVDQQVNTPI